MPRRKELFRRNLLSPQWGDIVLKHLVGRGVSTAEDVAVCIKFLVQLDEAELVGRMKAVFSLGRPVSGLCSEREWPPGEIL